MVLYHSVLSFCLVRLAVLSDYDSADPEENGSHSEVKHISCKKRLSEQHQCMNTSSLM